MRILAVAVLALLGPALATSAAEKPVPQKGAVPFKDPCRSRVVIPPISDSPIVNQLSVTNDILASIEWYACETEVNSLELLRIETDLESLNHKLDILMQLEIHRGSEK